MKTETADERRGVFGALRRIDDAVYTVEQAIVAIALITITVVLFVDVIARLIKSPDSKVGRIVGWVVGAEDAAARAAIDANVAPWVTVTVALALIGFGTYAGRRFARRRAGRGDEGVAMGREAGIAIGVAVGCVLLVWGFMELFVRLDSWLVYAIFFGVTASAYASVAVEGDDGGPRRVAVGGAVAGVLLAWGLAARFARLDTWLVYALFLGIAVSAYAASVALTRDGGARLRLAAAVAVGALLVRISVSYIPVGYTWSKAISLMLLLWVGMLSASICVHAGKHIRMEATTKLVPPAARRWVVGAGMLASAGFCALIAYLGFLYVFAPTASDDEYLTELFTWGGVRYVFGFEGQVGMGGMIEGTATAAHPDGIPSWIGIVSAPLGFGIAALRFVGAAVSAVLGGSYGANAAEEGMEEALALKAQASASPSSAASATGNDAVAAPPPDPLPDVGGAEPAADAGPRPDSDGEGAEPAADAGPPPTASKKKKKSKRGSK